MAGWVRGPLDRKVATRRQVSRLAIKFETEKKDFKELF